MTTLPSMTIAVITYNSSSYIVDCLESLQKSGVADSALMIVDDCSPDDTCAIVRERFPDVRVVALDRNGGHSRACNQAIKAVETEWIVLVDHDTEVKEDWYEQMCAAVVRHPDAGGIVSRAIFHNDGETIHSDGGYAHYIGNMRLRNGYTKLAQAEQGEEEIGAAGTTAMAVNREKALECGLFDEDFFIYLNDFEFSLRLRLLRYKLISAPDAVIYHKGGSQGVSYRGDGRYPPMRAYYILRNRWFMLLKLYQLKTLLLCAPPILLYELVLLAMSIQRGVIAPYLKGGWWVLSHLGLILQARKKTQALRVMGDAELLSAGNLSFVPDVVKAGFATRVKAGLDGFFNGYWNAVKGLLS